VSVETAKRGDEVFAGAAAATGIASGDDVNLGVLDELLDVGRGDLVEAQGSPAVEASPPRTPPRSIPATSHVQVRRQ
jgi:hypothetical protein